MEAEYGSFFLRNYQCGLWPRTSLELSALLAALLRAPTPKRLKEALPSPVSGLPEPFAFPVDFSAVPSVGLQLPLEDVHLIKNYAESQPSKVQETDEATSKPSDEVSKGGARSPGSAGAVSDIGADFSNEEVTVHTPSSSINKHSALAEEGSPLPLQPKDDHRWDQDIEMMLDRFFANPCVWERIAAEVTTTSKLHGMFASAPGKAHFRVQVPANYPGVQYRQSKDWEHRYPRYAKHGEVVSGIMEDSGRWLRISDAVFLPTRVGPLEILHPVSQEDVVDMLTSEELEGVVILRDEAEGEMEKENSGAWWNCGPTFDDSPQGEAAKASAVAGSFSVEEHTHRQLPRPISLTKDEGSHMPMVLPVELARSALNNMEEVEPYLNDPINPFSDTPRNTPVGTPVLRPRF